jgi:hypothetical protein
MNTDAHFDDQHSTIPAIAPRALARRGSRGFCRYANCRPGRHGHGRIGRDFAGDDRLRPTQEAGMIRKLSSGEYRLYSRKPDPKTGKRRNLGTFATREQAEKHEREVQYFKRH